MSVNVEFAADGRQGVVAEGTYVWDAAKRLGLRLPAECGGRGECDTCAVIVREGMVLLSELTNAERTRLSPERLAAGERLACQAKIERGGTLILDPVPVTEREETTEETKRDFSTEFRHLPLEKKLATLVELEVIAAAQTFKAMAELPSALIQKGLGVMAAFGRAREQRQRAEHRPTEQTNKEG
jgi:ferredoxin